jgi:hypothetical protein
MAEVSSGNPMRSPLIACLLSFCALALVVLHEYFGWFPAMAHWLLPDEPLPRFGDFALMLAMVFWAGCCLVIVFPSFMDRDGLWYVSGFATCLALVFLAAISARLGLLQNFSSLALLAFASNASSRAQSGGAH